MDLLAVSSLVVMSTYVTGFLSINAHLSKYGIHDFDLTNSRYMIVGVQFIAYLCFWYFPGGRHLIKSRSSDTMSFAELIEKNDSPLSKLTFDIYRIAHLAFLICISASSFSWIFFSTQDYIDRFLPFLLLALLLEFLLEYVSIERHYPRVAFSISLGIRLSILTVYFYAYEIFSATNLVFFTFLILTFIVWFLRRFPRSYNNIEVSVQVSIFLLVWSVQFGLFHYGSINTHLGGGNFQRIEIVVDDRYFEQISLHSMTLEERRFEADLLHENTKYVFLIIGQDIVRLPHDAIIVARFPCIEVDHIVIGFPKNLCG